MLRTALVALSLSSVVAVFGQDEVTWQPGMFAELPHRQLAPGHFGLVDLPVTSGEERARTWFGQGLAALHCGDDHEAQRAFREVITIDPDCAMGYLGLAWSLSDASRVKENSWYAWQRREGASRFEQQLIGAWASYVDARVEPEMVLVDAEKGTRRAKASPPVPAARRRLIADLSSLAQGSDQAGEIGALILREQLRHGLPIGPQSLGGLAGLPSRHPAARFRLLSLPADAADDSLWQPALAAPSSGMMWRFAAAGFERRDRLAPAAAGFAASLSTDQARLSQLSAMPYELEGYASGAERLGQCLLRLGAFAEATTVAEHLLSLPRHPQRPLPTAAAGRRLLLTTFLHAEQWDDILTYADGPFRESGDPSAEADWQYAIGHACARTDRLTRARECLAALSEVEDEVGTRVTRLKALVEIGAGTAADRFAGLEASGLDRHEVASLLLASGQDQRALAVAEQLSATSAVALATRAHVEWSTGHRDQAQETLSRLRQLTPSADVAAVPFARLEAVARAAGISGDWRIEQPISEAITAEIAKLKPARWTPPSAPEFQLDRGRSGTLSSRELSGKPVLLVFYLGFGCIHCVEQLHELTPRYDDFRRAGIEIVAIGTDSVDDVRAAIQQGIEADSPVLPFQILCDPGEKTFEAFKCRDQFSDEPLHGTFLVDAAGRIRWRDISEEPFMETQFLLDESRRLLSLPQP